MTFTIGHMTYIKGQSPSIMGDPFMLEPILGSLGSERVLIYLHARGEGYAREIAQFFDTALSPIQKQLERLESGGVLVSRGVGRTILYSFNPRYPFLNELAAMLEKALTFYSDEDRERLVMNRRRPRRKAKPL